ncbi:FtsW/RodA/SpoVE family cell cycle protein [Alkalibaculum sp. M08DMB]|uniref:Probable peptidoglycan glycosyltransferase FtsW n=1 Tax=Alkalibaculum sporogenes TaxID=2655001 RepID=A0A6A7K771_9FIRM|nr:FtsW/RodA/SpoVE family cell cycle protein [Alkalibaculum sporogenes]MPW25226.1 FtsW/RodA/SpoVE family cell cycle protein [Alkalibaculum sporogenes]
MPIDKTSEFIESVRQQIRWKKAQPVVIEEVENHIADQKNAFIQDGLNEDKALDKAIKEMGDPIVVGEQFNSIHKPKPDWAILLLISSLFILGILIQLYLFRNNDLSSNNIYGQLLGILIGIPIFFIAYLFDFTIIGKYPKIIFSFLFILNVYYIIEGNRVNGAITDTIYPLLLFPTVYAGLVYSMRNKGYIGIFICSVAFLIPASIAFVSPSMSTLLLLYISCLTILTAAVVKGWFKVKKLLGLLFIYLPTLFAFISLVYYFTIFSYRGERIKIFFLNDKSMGGVNWITTQIHTLLSNSKIIGTGSPIGQETIQIAESMPAIHTDFILTYSVYNFGWIVFAGILLLFAALIIRGFIITAKQKSVLGYLTSLSIITTMMVQCIIYIFANLGLMIFTPLSFPLLSYGGKYLVVNMFLLGLLLSVFRTGDYVRDKKGILVGIVPFIQYDNGTIHINLKSKTTK